MKEFSDQLAARLKVVKRVAARICREEVAHERDWLNDLDAKEPVGVNLQIGFVVKVVVGERSVRAEFDAAQLAKVDETDALIVCRHAGKTDALRRLIEEHLYDAGFVAALFVKDA